MSWQIFRDNIQKVCDTPHNINNIDTIAKLYAVEYDAAIKRGGDLLNNIKVSKGNVELMEQLFKVALQNGLNQSDSYDLVGEMGKGVIAYWTGAIMEKIPVPVIPAPNTISNISIVSNTVTNSGEWQSSKPES